MGSESPTDRRESPELSANAKFDSLLVVELNRAGARGMRNRTSCDRTYAAFGLNVGDSYFSIEGGRASAP